MLYFKLGKLYTLMTSYQLPISPLVYLYWRWKDRNSEYTIKKDDAEFST